MHFSHLCLVFNAFLLKDGCFANPELENLFSFDDFEEPGPVGGLAFMSSSDPNSGDPPSSSLSFPLQIGSSNLFPETDPASNDDLSSLFKIDQVAPTSELTDATLLSACATDQSLTDEQQPLKARDHESCPPSAVPLPPNTLQLFEDPLRSLEGTINPTNSDENAPSPSVEPSYPGLLTPEEQEERERNPGGLYHNTEPLGGEYWQDYSGEVIWGNDQSRHCEIYLILGFILPLCCQMALARPDPLDLPMYYISMGGCEPNLGTSIIDKDV